MFIDQLMDVDMVIAQDILYMYTSAVASSNGFDIQVSNHYITL